MNRIGTTTTAAQADPTDDVPEHELELTKLLLRQLTDGVPHGDLLQALLRNFEALAKTHRCCTHAAGRAALSVGGRLLVIRLEQPANTCIH